MIKSDSNDIENAIKDLVQINGVFLLTKVA